MKSPLIVGGSIGLAVVLSAILASGLMWLSSPRRGIPEGKPATFPTPDASGSGSTESTVDQAAQINLIRRSLGKPELLLDFDSIQGLANAVARQAAVYVDAAGSKYYVDLQTGRFSVLEPPADSGPKAPGAQDLDLDALRSIATRFAQANSPRLLELKGMLAYEEGCKIRLCFFRWDARTLPIDWSGTGWELTPPFLQVGLLSTGDVFSYNDTLDLFEQTLPVAVPQPTPADGLGGGAVQDGPFTFDLRLFRDPTLTLQPLSPSLYSDLQGCGAYMYWSYTGTEVIGPVTTYWGTQPHVEQLLQATYSSVSTGSTGGRTGGILLPGGAMIPGHSQAGDREQLVLKVVTPNGDFGAILLFTLQKGARGLEPAEISIEPLAKP